MKFHEYRLSKFDSPPDWVERLSIEQFYRYCIDRMQQGADFGEMAELVCSEAQHVRCKRPFYNIYPAIRRCLENTCLDFTLIQIGHLEETIAMCFAYGHEPSIEGSKVRSMLVGMYRGMVNLNTGEETEEPYMQIAGDIELKNGDRKYICLRYSGTEMLSDAFQSLDSEKSLLRIAVGVALIAKDERFVEPILLNRDQGKKLDAEGTKKAIERAKNRGRNGKSIGKYLDVSPHMRKPHFATRWTGKGGQVPRLVPVKGCLVSRSKLYPVPTGYMDE